MPKRLIFSFTRVTLVTKGQYVGALGVFGLLSNFGLVIHISQRVDITRYQDKQRALHVVCGSRYSQDKRSMISVRDDDLSNFKFSMGGRFDPVRTPARSVVFLS